MSGFLKMLQDTGLVDSMGRPLNRFPSYLLHADGTGRIYWRGQFRQLPGPFQSPESLAEFHRLCAIVAATGDLPPVDTTVAMTVAELVRRFLEHARRDYSKDSKEPLYLDYATRELVAMFGPVPVESIRPAELRAVRAAMLANVCRKTANRRTTQIVRVFRWGVQEGIVPVGVWHALKSVDAIQPGREGSTDYERIGPVSDDHFAAVGKLVSARIRDIMTVHRATGMRSGELLSMSPIQCDMTGDDWLYFPRHHKTKNHQKDRIVGIPREIVPILLEHMPTAPDRPFFPIKVNSYYNAVKRACVNLGIEPWHPHQLRHTAATNVKAIVGEEAAATLLSVSNEKTAKVYARVTPEAVRRIMDEVRARKNPAGGRDTGGAGATGNSGKEQDDANGVGRVAVAGDRGGSADGDSAG